MNVYQCTSLILDSTQFDFTTLIPLYGADITPSSLQHPSNSLLNQRRGKETQCKIQTSLYQLQQKYKLLNIKMYHS